MKIHVRGYLFVIGLLASSGGFARPHGPWIIRKYHKTDGRVFHPCGNRSLRNDAFSRFRQIAEVLLIGGRKTMFLDQLLKFFSSFFLT